VIAALMCLVASWANRELPSRIFALGRGQAEICEIVAANPVPILDLAHDEDRCCACSNIGVSSFKPGDSVAVALPGVIGRVVAQVDCRGILEVNWFTGIPHTADDHFSPQDHPSRRGLSEVFKVQNNVAGISDVTNRAHMLISNRLINKIEVRPRLNVIRFPTYIVGLTRIAISSTGGNDGVARFFRPYFGMLGGFFGPFGRAPSCCEGQAAYQTTEGTEEPGSVSRTLGGIGGLPLGAKIGGTLIVAFVAWLVQVRGFICLTQGRGHVTKGVGYLILGAVGWIAPIAAWWASS
jgi:hypothetical protein